MRSSDWSSYLCSSNLTLAALWLLLLRLLRLKRRHADAGQLLVELGQNIVGDIDARRRGQGIALVEDNRGAARLHDLVDDRAEARRDLLVNMGLGRLQGSLTSAKLLDRKSTRLNSSH